MKNISIVLLVLPLFLCADLKVRANARDFSYNYEINVVEGLTPQENASAFKCQATRLSKEWFITAAHCLQPMCGNGCILQARLFVSPDYEMDMQTKISSASDNAVKIFAGGSSNKAVYDIALIKFSPEKSQYVYRNNKTGYRVSEGDFIDEIGKQKHNLAARGTDFPALLKLKRESLSVLDSKLIVAYVWNGHDGALKSFAPVFYSPQKNFLFTLDFGIVSGFSGSGVMTEKGELAGIVSANGILRRGLEKGPKYNFFVAFDDDIINFIAGNVGGITVKTSDEAYFKPLTKEISEEALNAVEAVEI